MNGHKLTQSNGHFVQQLPFYFFCSSTSLEVKRRSLAQLIYQARHHGLLMGRYIIDQHAYMNLSNSILLLTPAYVKVDIYNFLLVLEISILQSMSLSEFPSLCPGSRNLFLEQASP